MMNIRKYILLAVVSAFAYPVFAQQEKDLQKAIVVEKDFVPVETKAVKPATSPTESPMHVQKTNLKVSDWTIPAKFDTQLVPQSPIQYSGNQQFQNKPGYFNFGIGNYLNSVGSLGYRMVDNKNMKLGAWLQHNTTSGGVNPDALFDVKQFVVSERLGVDFSNLFEKGQLSAGLGYHFDKFNYYGANNEFVADDRQSVNDFAVQLMWRNIPDESNHLNYHIGVEYDYLKMGNGMFSKMDGDKPSYVDGLGENKFSAQVGAEMVLDNFSFVGMDLEFSAYNAKNPYRWNDREYLAYEDSESSSMLSLKPYYSKRTDRMNLRIGAVVDLTFNGGQFFRIAPDVLLDWALSRKVGLYAKASGGNHINTLREASFRNRYVNPSLLLPLTHTMVDAELGLNLGRFKGLSVSPFVGFVASKNAMLPFVARDVYAAQPDVLNSVNYGAVDMNGFKAGLNVSYVYNDMIEFGARYEFTPQASPSSTRHDDSGIVSDDRAEHSLIARLKVSPIEKLDVRLSYELRSGRFCKSIRQEPVLDVEMVEFSRMANVSNLNLGATYQIKDWISANVEFGNLLNRRYEIFHNLYAQRFNFLVGVGLKF